MATNQGNNTRMYRIIICLLFPITGIGQTGLLEKYLAIQQQRMHFNGVVLVTKNNQVLHRVAIGNACYELEVPMRGEAVFKVASISKQFTAMLVVLAAREGKLRLEDSLAVFFPKLKSEVWRSISLHQLLTHTAGVPHNEGIKDYWLVKSLRPLTQEQALKEIFAMELLFKPGSNMKYSSPGYFLLACILETVYKQPYAAILEEKIIKPLPMKHTGVYVTGKMVNGMVAGYHLLGDSLIQAPGRDYSLMKGSGDLYSTAEDLAKWNHSFNSMWNDSIQKLLFTAYTPAYGYGWYIRRGKRQAYYHGGGTFGCSALSAWYPGEQLSIVILSNVSALPVNELWNDIEKIVFNEPFEMPETTTAITLDTDTLQSFTGLYTQGSQQLRITFLNGHLFAQLNNNPPFEIYPETPLKFFGKKVNVHLIFKKDKAGNVISLKAAHGGQTLPFNKQ